MTTYPWYIRWVFILLFFILSGYILYTCQSFLIPFSIGILLTFLLMPVSRWLELKRVPRLAAIIISLLLMIVVVGGLLFFLSSQFLSFAEEMPSLRTMLSDKLGRVQEFISDRFHISEKRQIAWIEQQLLALFNSGGQIFGDIFSATGTFLAAATLIPIYIFFFTYYRHKFIDFVKYISSADNHDWIINMMHRTSTVSQKYLVGLMIDIAILSVLNSVGFLLLGIQHAVLLGVVAALLNIIPYIGVLIGSILPVMIALLTKDSGFYALGALGVCVAVQFLDNNFITPKVVGSAVSINPLATMIALLIGGMLWGLVGMMLFIPFLGMLKVVFDHVDSLKPFGYLIGEETKMKSAKKKTKS